MTDSLSAILPTPVPNTLLFSVDSGSSFPLLTPQSCISQMLLLPGFPLGVAGWRLVTWKRGREGGREMQDISSHMLYLGGISDNSYGSSAQAMVVAH